MAGDADNHRALQRDLHRQVVFGRRQGHKLKPQRQALMRDLLPQIEIDLGDQERPEASATLPEPTPFSESTPYEAIDPRSLFAKGTKEIWLEIGFGAGEHLAWHAARHPDIGFIGCEPFLNGVSALLDRIARENLSNVRIFPDDARLLMARLSSGGIDRLSVLFPDPWPKSRHQKRRIMSAKNIASFADIMADGSEFRFASDHAEYGCWTLLKMLAEPQFRWLAEGPDDWRKRPADWPETRYEGKAREADRTPLFLRYERVARSAVRPNSA